MSSSPLHLEPAAIAFGTDGWRGVLGVDITIERLLPVAAAAAAELAHSAPPELESRTVVIGYDRRFLAPELAAAIAAAVRGVGLEPLLAQEPLPTPAGVGKGSCANSCLLYTSPSPRDRQKSRMPSSA